MENLTTLHWLLAFAGSAIYILLKIQEKSNEKDYKFGQYFKDHWASTLATILMIPVLLLVLSSNFSEMFPINNATATLVGYQTNSMFKTIMGAGRKKYINEENDITKGN